MFKGLHLYRVCELWLLKVTVKWCSSVAAQQKGLGRVFTIGYSDKNLFFVCFGALRPKSTAMVIAGRSVHLTTLFPGQT